jgi:hypothetical protein
MSDIIIATSIAPRAVKRQLAALETWMQSTHMKTAYAVKLACICSLHEDILHTGIFTQTINETINRRTA